MEGIEQRVAIAAGKGFGGDRVSQGSKHITLEVGSASGLVVAVDGCLWVSGYRISFRLSAVLVNMSVKMLIPVRWRSRTLALTDIPGCNWVTLPLMAIVC